MESATNLSKSSPAEETRRKKKISSRANGGSEVLVDEFVVSGERFSSDEEGEIVLNGEEKKSKKKSSKSSPSKAPVNVLTEESALIVDGLHISDLSDNELYNKLNEFGVDVGPIVDSTRNIYRKKLAILMRGESNFNHSASPSKVENGMSNGKEEFSADEEALELSEEIHDEEPVVEETIPEVIIRKISRRSNASSVKKVSRTATPLILNSPTNLGERTRISTSSNIRPDRFTPTPRRSIHSYKGGQEDEGLRQRYRASQTAAGALNRGEDDSILLEHDEDSAKGHSAKKSSLCSKFLRILPYIFLFFVFLATSLYVYQNYAQKKEFSKLIDGVLNWAHKTSASLIDKYSSPPSSSSIPSAAPPLKTSAGKV